MQDLSSPLLNHPATQLALTLIQSLRHQLQDPAFLDRHRRDAKAFTRERVLSFPVVLLMILQKSVKSLQVRLHEFLDQWSGSGPAVTAGAGAFTRARAKLRHSAYIELNTQVVLPTVYRHRGGWGLRSWRGHRVLGIDSSLLRLPVRASLSALFGQVECTNQNGKSSVAYPQARISVLYDLLNHIGWDARLVPYTVAETELARCHLAYALQGDLVLCDRGYAGLFWFILMHSLGIEFVVRCSQGSFGAVQELFKRNEADLSREVILEAQGEVKKELRQAGLPTQLRVRLVTVRLKTGELEVLATSLLDPQRYPTQEFAQVYHWRWGIETYYGRLKGRLELENWSGKTEEAIRQDFHAAIFLSNLESIVSRPAEAQLAQDTGHRSQPAQLNRAVCLHTLKHRIIELLAGRQPVKKVLASLIPLFQANPVAVRPHRTVPRRTTPPGQAYHHQRNVRKIVF